MDKKYEHITEMENILVSQQKLINKLDDVLQEINAGHNDFKKLIEYYYSPQREQDLKDDENNLIPKDLHRGVLSEDEIYNLLVFSHQSALDMIETALEMLRR